MGNWTSDTVCFQIEQHVMGIVELHLTKNEDARYSQQRSRYTLPRNQMPLKRAIIDLVRAA